jgi:sulfur-carrier protein adenylyltransferase/sulfurtransferase
MDTDFSRYACQMALPGFSIAGQRLLQQAKVLIVGAGGLGCPAAQYLVASGVGTVGIADFDVISVSNLHRQILYTPFEVGMKKASVACNRLQDQNPDCILVPHLGKVLSTNVLELVKRYDAVLDCTDNFETKYLLNDACCVLGKPLIFGAIYRYDGQVAVWNVENPDGTRTPNYRDLFPEVDAAGIPDCNEGGVTPPLAGIIGCMQANEAIKWITGNDGLIAGKLLVFDALTMTSRLINIGSVTSTPITAIAPSVVVPEISAHDLKICLRNDTVELVDVRTAEERARFHIGGRHIPLADIDKNLAYLHSGKQIVVYCESGKRSTMAAKTILKRFPTLKIYSLLGGMKNWKDEQ